MMTSSSSSSSSLPLVAAPSAAFRRGSSSSSRSSVLVLVATSLFLLSLVGDAEALTQNSVCVCRCCSHGDCHPIAGGTFPVDSCSNECGKDSCEERYANTTTVCTAGTGVSYVKAECFARNAVFPQLTCFILIGLLTGLVVFGVAKDYVPALAAYSTKHFNY
eukprot:Rhum_TRINITY_DN11206_c1_g1::Rhum_TRINITY_DN11206_c1_g1_i1::g.43327::m.43327